MKNHTKKKVHHNHADCITKVLQPTKKGNKRMSIWFCFIIRFLIFCSNDHIAAQTWLSIFDTYT